MVGVGKRTRTTKREAEIEGTTVKRNVINRVLRTRQDTPGIVILDSLGWGGPVTRSRIGSAATLNSTLEIRNCSFIQFQAPTRILVKRNSDILGEVPEGALVEVICEPRSNIILEAVDETDDPVTKIGYSASGSTSWAGGGGGLTGAENNIDITSKEGIENGETYIVVAGNSCTAASWMQIQGYDALTLTYIGLTDRITLDTMGVGGTGVAQTITWRSEMARRFPGARRVAYDIAAGEQFDTSWFYHLWRTDGYGEGYTSPPEDALGGFSTVVDHYSDGELAT